MIAYLEEGGNANVLPKIPVFSVAKGFERPVVADIKGILLKYPAGDCMQIMNERIVQGLEDYDKVEEEEKPAE